MGPGIVGRLYGALTRRNWTYALGELTLIVLGVVTALAVDAWWERRNDAATEREYLRQLLVDVDANGPAITSD